jgi:hypothetical protein
MCSSSCSEHASKASPCEAARLGNILRHFTCVKLNFLAAFMTVLSENRRFTSPYHLASGSAPPFPSHARLSPSNGISISQGLLIGRVCMTRLWYGV